MAKRQEQIFLGAVFAVGILLQGIAALKLFLAAE
jgi:hypothetical protein